MVRSGTGLGGTLTADGNPDTLIDDTTPGDVLDGWVSLENMQSGDSVTIVRYVKSLSGGNLEQCGPAAVYSGVQGDPVVHFLPATVPQELKITLQQTAGTYRNFPYQFYH